MQLPFIGAVFLVVLTYCTAKKIQEDYIVTGLVQYGLNETMYSGLIPVTEDEGELFFFLVKQKNRLENEGPQKLIIWLNGGPGCSSMVGNLGENGPFTVSFDDSYSSDGNEQHHQSKYKLTPNPYSWHNVGDVLYVEQPIATGFSTPGTKDAKVRDQHEMARDFHNFLRSFTDIFTDLHGAELFITGESYAGFYIPSIADHIVRHKEDMPLPLTLAGLAIGNGILDVIAQEGSYTEYAYSHGLIPLGAKEYIDAFRVKCTAEVLAAGGTITKGNLEKCGTMGMVMEAAGMPNEYNTATFTQYKWIAPGSAVDTFLNDVEIQKTLNVHGIDSAVGPMEWKVCSDSVSHNFNHDHPLTVVPTLQFLIDTDVKLLLYSGEFDLNVNSLGTLHVLEANKWRGHNWNEAERSLWRTHILTIDGARSADPDGLDVGGEYFSLDDDAFAFLIVRNSGHLMPTDQPAAALDMISRFTSGRSFADKMLPTEAFYLKAMESGLEAMTTGDSADDGDDGDFDVDHDDDDDNDGDDGDEEYDDYHDYYTLIDNSPMQSSGPRVEVEATTLKTEESRSASLIVFLVAACIMGLILRYRAKLGVSCGGEGRGFSPLAPDDVSFEGIEANSNHNRNWSIPNRSGSSYGGYQSV
jgi:carboxypeptidase C (cathepsin A)